MRKLFPASAMRQLLPKAILIRAVARVPVQCRGIRMEKPYCFRPSMTAFTCSSPQPRRCIPAKRKKHFSPGKDVLTFSRQLKIPAWAQPAMQWAVAEGYISGMGDNQLAPQGTANRAEIASVIMRFMEATAETAE